ncbi:MAG: hypothetical protein ACOYY2_03965 [Actinomycetota bacterium]
MPSFRETRNAARFAVLDDAGDVLDRQGRKMVARPAAPTTPTAADNAAVDGVYGAEEAGVITNLRTRVAELEAVLRAAGLIT